MQRSAPYRPPLLRRPSAAGTQNSTPGRCPFLGTPADPGTSLAFPSEANHCFRSRFPIPISSIHQENYCLSAHYETCPVYRQYMTEGEAAAVAALPVVGAAAVAEPVRRPAEMGGSAIAPAVAAGAGMALGAGRAVASPPDGEPDYPDFATDPGPDPVAHPARRAAGIEGRYVLLGLLLLAMLLLAGWAWRTFLDGRNGATAAQGTVVTLPTLAVTAEAIAEQAGNPTGVAIGAAAEATATALAATVGDATSGGATPGGATPGGATAGDDLSGEAGAASDATGGELDSVAATATAMFAGVVAPAECHAPEWWVPYVTMAGDTIDALAAARGILPEELIVANCLAGPDLPPGTPLQLPPVGVIVLLPGVVATLIPPTATVAPGVPTRRPPLALPTATFPVVIIIPTVFPIVPEPGEPTSSAPRPPRPPITATSPSFSTPTTPTATPPGLFPTATPPGHGQATSTPPGLLPTATPPGNGPATSTPPVSP